MPAASPQAETGTLRYVLLGASNLTNALPLLIENLRCEAAGHCDITAAAGYGRSYGAPSRFLFRELPGIVESGLWQTLDNSETGDIVSRALITDIGNDLLYGFSAGEILEWIELCAAQLSTFQTDVILTLPPLQSVQHLSPWRYRLMRTLFFPRCRLPLKTVLQSAEQLTEELVELGKRRGFPVVKPPQEWYGFDPIHIRRSLRAGAWQDICAYWKGFDVSQWSSRPARRLKHQLRHARPERYRRCGRSREVKQPAVNEDALRVFLY